jgi:hypothetical protein
MRSLLISTFLLSASTLFAQAYPTDGLAVHSALADFDRDGFPDMAIVNEPPDQSGAPQTVDVFFNNRSGGFGTFTSYAIPSSGPVIAVDVNGDGWPDLVIAPGLGTVSTVLLNNGDGTFRMGTPPTTKMTPISFVAGDFNKDGKVDLAAVEGKQIEILLNKGSGTFTEGQILALSGSSSLAVVRDFDNDGNLDIANAEGKALVWWGKGNGTFGTPTQVPAATKDGFSSLVGADFNNDGLLDLAMGVSHYNGCTNPENTCGTTTAYVYKNLGGRKFGLVSSYLIGDDLGGILYTADVNGDLNPDLVDLINGAGVSSGDVFYRAGNGNGTFGANTLITDTSSVDLSFRDLNLDSLQDLVLPSYFPEGEAIVIPGSGHKNCAGPGSASLAAKFCSPANNSTVSSPVLVTASGNSPIGVQRLEVWVDGKKVYEKFGDQLSKRISLTPGKHRVTVVAVDKYVGTASSLENVTVN